MKTKKRFQLADKKTIRNRAVQPMLSSANDQLGCGATGGSIVSTVLL